MKRMTFRKSFLLSGILIFSVLVLGQLGWACDELDYNDYLCVEELDIKRVRLDYDKDEIHILGKNFRNGGKPTVTLGDLDLYVYGFDDTEIVTTFPAVEEGQYKLRVSTGEGRNCKDKHSVKIDHDNKPSCPQPPPCTPCKDGEPGPQGPKGDKGDPGVKSAEAITLPSGSQATASLNTDTSVLTIGVPKGDKGDPGLNGTNGQDGAPGLQGPEGPMALTNWTVIYSEPQTFKNDIPFVINTVTCPDENFMVTGGGFSATTNVIVTESKPFQFQDAVTTKWGWHVIGVPGEGNIDTIYSLQTWAVCVQVQ